MEMKSQSTAFLLALVLFREVNDQKILFLTMPTVVQLNKWLMIIWVIIGQTTGISYNQPKFCSNASWNETAVLFADNSTSNSDFYGILINTNNTVYVADRKNNRIVVWLEGSTSVSSTISGGLKNPYSLFLTITGDMYVDNGDTKETVDMWLANAVSSVSIWHVIGACYGLFVDIHDNLYCSMQYLHQVVGKPVGNHTNTSLIIFGTGCSGMASNMLYKPMGIFVDINFNLYVADSGNDRIQMFSNGQPNAITVAGNGSTDPFPIKGPTGIILDADRNLFIVDQKHHRIVRSGSNGFQCIIGCTGSGNYTSNQLSYPRALSFDSHGNIFITDSIRRGIQQFLLADNSCNETKTWQGTVTPTANPAIPYSITLPSIISNPSTSSYPTVLPYNQPKFCSQVSWNLNATTLLTMGRFDTSPLGIFVDTNNTVYIADRKDNRVIIWTEGASQPRRNISGGLNSPYSLFVTINGDIYVDNGKQKGRVDRWASNGMNRTPAMYVSRACYGLFVDVADHLYCSMRDLHQVVKKSLNSNTNTSTIVAGTGCPGMTTNMLKHPNGIFVDIHFNLYVADSDNNRIQFYPPGQLRGITEAGNGAAQPISLHSPTGVIVDVDRNLFIVDQKNHRIVRSGPGGFRCIVGCTGSNGLASNQLLYPRTLSFDRYGNIYVVDTNNHRIQKFLLASNSCDETTTLQPIILSTANTEATSLITSTSRLVTIHTSNLQSTDAITELTNSVTHTIDHVKTSSEDSTMVHSATLSAPINPLTLVFHPPSCPDPDQTGLNCNVSTKPCELLAPCLNKGTCTNNNTTRYGYTCTCPPGFNGTHCEIDIRPCKPNTCWNNGVCNDTSSTTFSCSCQPGWTGAHCETKINYCENVTCLNNGVCRPLFLNFTCECLGTSYSGRYCEITATKTVVLQTVSKSFGYIAILFLLGVVLFIVVMDVLKYGFGIDPAKDELEKIRRANRVKRRRAPPVIQRFTYVNAPPITTTTVETIASIEETTV